MVSFNRNHQKLILRKHNTLRNYFASGKEKNFKSAAKMNELKWDPTLAYLAELNVKQCWMSHDACHKTDQFVFPGQNLYVTAYNLDYPDIESVIERSMDFYYNEISATNSTDLRKLTTLTNEK